jgi:predicted RNA-binding protein
MQIHVTQHIDPANDKIGTDNEIVVESIKTGEPKGYEHTSIRRPKTEAEIRCDQLTEALAQATEMNQQLRNRIAELELRVEQLEGTPKLASSLREAQLIDSIVNG